ncbi:class I SAM-dependent methyltransferase [Cytobacillus praedii]|uniref:class I SAM-dependent methyltransferase n=1 Tax=Cytobacillus praedii TaxID=1742358 RepID=UPI003F80599E
MFWTEKSTKWYKQAAEYTKYHQAIYKEIYPFIPVTASVLDVGCGLGFLSTEIAQNAKAVTAIDIDDLPLKDLEERLKQENIMNLHVIKSDWSVISEGPKWDVVVSSFFKSNIEDIGRLFEYCCERLILVVSNGSENSFLPERNSHHYLKRADLFADRLRTRGIPFYYKNCLIQFGQPFSSVAEAREFIKHYQPNCDNGEIDYHIRSHVKNIIEDAYGNQYFLSNVKEVCVFVIEKNDYMY